MAQLPKPLTPAQLDAFRPKPAAQAEAPKNLTPISEAQRAENKARRLAIAARLAGGPNDGLTIRFWKTCSSGAEGQTAIVESNLALRLINAGAAESAE